MKYSKLPLSILLIFLAFTYASQTGFIPSGFELLSQLKTAVGEHWFWLAVFCIFLEALVLLCLYFPGQFIAVLLVLSSGPTTWDIILLSLAMVMAATAGSCVNYLIGRYLGKNTGTNQQPYKTISYKTLLPAMVHSSGLAFFTLHWGLQRGTPWLLLVSSLINIPYYI